MKYQTKYDVNIIVYNFLCFIYCNICQTVYHPEKIHQCINVLDVELVYILIVQIHKILFITLYKIYTIYVHI